MQTRKIGPYTVSAVSLGCMNLSHAYGTPPDRKTAQTILNTALDLGCTHLDTASLYGFGANETLIGETVMHRRSEFMLASKCGLFRNAEGVREVDGSPETVRRVTEDSLKRLKTDVIDLHYLHRWDKRYPIEECVGVMADMVREGKIRQIGLCEVSAETLRKAHAVHPIAALQTEYSIWTRNPELGVLDTCRELGIGFVAFSPMTRGFLCGAVRDMAKLPEKDIRQWMPRFQGENFERNLKLLPDYEKIARDAGHSMAEITLAWVLAQGDHIVPIPGTTSLAHLKENFGAAEITLDADTRERMDTLVNQKTVAGPRYTAKTQREIDTETFPGEYD